MKMLCNKYLYSFGKTHLYISLKKVNDLLIILVLMQYMSIGKNVKLLE